MRVDEQRPGPLRLDRVVRQDPHTLHGTFLGPHVRRRAADRSLFVHRDIEPASTWGRGILVVARLPCYLRWQMFPVLVPHVRQNGSGVPVGVREAKRPVIIRPGTFVRFDW